MSKDNQGVGYRLAAVVTPHDTNAMPFFPLRRLYIGGTGHVTVKLTTGGTALFSACPVGTQLDGEFERVMGTGTTATLITAQG